MEYERSRVECPLPDVRPRTCISEWRRRATQLHPMKVAARLRAGWPFSTAFLLRHLTSLSPLPLSLLLSRAIACSPPLILSRFFSSFHFLPPSLSVCVPGVCTHPHTVARRGGLHSGAPTLSPPSCRPRVVVLVRTVASYRLAAQHRRYRGRGLSSAPQVAMYAGRNTLAFPFSTGKDVHVLARSSSPMARNADAHQRDVNKAAAVARGRLAHLRNRVVHESIN